VRVGIQGLGFGFGFEFGFGRSGSGSGSGSGVRFGFGFGAPPLPAPRRPHTPPPTQVAHVRPRVRRVLDGLLAKPKYARVARMRSHHADRVMILWNLRARMRSRRCSVNGPTVWRAAWGTTATNEGQRIWVGSRVERELQELEWARRDRQYILGREFKASY
jgi:hypothetical protein